MQRHFGALSGDASLLIIIKRERPIIIKVLPRPAGSKVSSGVLVLDKKRQPKKSFLCFSLPAHHSKKVNHVSVICVAVPPP